MALERIRLDEPWRMEAIVKLNATMTEVDGVPAATTAAITALKAASNTWSNTNNFTGALQSNGVSIVPFGVQKWWIPANEMQPAATNGAAPGSHVGASNAQNYYTLDFDQTTNEVAFFTRSMPSRWNEGTVTFRAVWTAEAGTGDVIWLLDGTAFSDDDALDGAFGSPSSSTDTLIATGDMHRAPESNTITIAGTPAANDLVNFRLRRNAGSGSDTLNADAKLIGIELYWTADAAVDVA